MKSDTVCIHPPYNRDYILYSSSRKPPTFLIDAYVQHAYGSRAHRGDVDIFGNHISSSRDNNLSILQLVYDITWHR